MKAEGGCAHKEWIARSLGRGSLAPIGRDDLEMLAAELHEERYAGGTAVFRRDELPARVHVVRSGTIELSRTLDGSRVGYQVLRPGDVFGDVPMLLQMREPFDARAIEDSVVLSIDSARLFDLLQQRPALARRWLVSLAQRLADFQARVGALLAGGLEERIATFLLHEPDPAEVEITQATLAGLLGARRTSVNQALRRLQERDLVALGYGRISVVDAESLARLLPTA